MNPLEILTQLSHEFGTPDYVKGGGGNTSVKDEHTLWVKPSGTTLAGLSPEAFVVMDRSGLQALFDMEVPDDKDTREARVKALMTAAVHPGQNKRPSVEAPLHHLLPDTYVVHTHPTLVNGLTCARDGETASAVMFPDALWVPYIDPGFTLCLDVSRRVADYAAERGHAPRVLILENHGIFVTGESPDDIRAAYAPVMDALAAAYHQAGIPETLDRGPPLMPEAVQAHQQELAGRLGIDPAGIVVEAPFEVPHGPLTPDHIVYAKSYAYRDALTEAGLAAFRDRHGYTPHLFVVEDAVLAWAGSASRSRLAMDMTLDGAHLVQQAAAFGGVQFMSDEARLFIEHWEVESYRQQQVQ